jgi:predicted GNAT superfamily acetyltransferase
MTNTNQIEIRSLQFIEELEEVKRLEGEIWGEHDTVPTHQTITAVKNGGIVLGAYLNGRLIGFQYSFPGFNGQSVYLCSHMLGIDIEFRNFGIGKLLKDAQRKEALKQGYSLITWTYDPLESINGYLNIAKLGGTCSTYIENCYGEMDDLLNSGIPSDRFLVEWHIKEIEEINKELSQSNLNNAIENSMVSWKLTEDGLPIPFNEIEFSPSELTYVAVPKDYRMIRETNFELAMDWRMTTRNIFKTLFDNNWKVIDFYKDSESEIQVNFYVLKKMN